MARRDNSYPELTLFMLVVYNLEWDPFEMEGGEEIRILTLTVEEALAATREDYRDDTEAVLALWLYAGRKDKDL